MSKMKIDEPLFSSMLILVNLLNDYQIAFQSLDLSTTVVEKTIILQRCKTIFGDITFALNKVKSLLSKTTDTLEPTLSIQLKNIERHIQTIKTLI